MALTDNLISYWKLDESSGNASDSVGSNTLTNSNVTYSTGKINNGANFNGSNTVLSNTSLSLNGLSNITYSAWVKPTSLPTTSGNIMSLVSKFSVTGQGGMDLRLYNDGGTQKLQCQFAYSDGFNNLLTYNTSLPTNTYTHVAVTRNNSTSVLYINGVQVSTLAQSSRTFGNIENDFTVGAFHLGTVGRYFNGQIDEVGVWSRALSADEVSQIFNSGRANAYPLTDTPSLYGGIAYWKLDESSGNASDATGSGNTLTNVNGATYSPAKINNGVNFGTSNTNKMLNIASNLGINNTSFTISMWVKLNTEISSSYYAFFRQFNTSSHVGFEIVYDYNSGTRRLVFRKIRQNVAFHDINHNITLGTTNFYFLTIKYNSSTGVMTGYVNGSSIGSLTQSGTGGSSALTNQFQIGARESTWYSPITADEVGVWNRALSDAEVSELYNGGNGLQYPFTPTFNQALGRRRLILQ